MSMLNIPYKFICQIFDIVIFIERATTVCARFLNQISWPTLAKWQWRHTLASRGRRMYHHMSLGPDRWSKSWVKPIFWPDAVVGPCGSPGNIDMVSYSSRGDALSRLYNCKRLVQYIGSNTMVFYSRRFTRSYFFGKYNMKPLPL